MGDEGEVSNEFKEIHAGRRLVVEYPMSPATKIQAVVLDSADTLGVEFVMKCAAMLVPSGKEEDWMYSSEGGQWQLLTSAGVTRLILLSRICGPGWADKKEKRPYRHDNNHRHEKRMELHDQEKGGRRLKVEEGQQADMLRDHHTRLPVATRHNTDDEAMKHMIGPLVLALAPKVSFDTGVPSIPFVSYTDNVLQRVLVEEALSPLTGLMRVEDVELESENPDFGGLPKEEEPSQLKSKQLARSWRRRLIFRRMPNLIQTEVLLTLQPFDSKRRVSQKKRESDHEEQMVLKRKKNPRLDQLDHVNIDRVVRQVDHTKLVHKYLPPIVAGFVLVAPRLDTCFTSDRGQRARILSIGVGGGALPIFLQKHFRFHIQAVDLDVEVLQLARKHFGLKEDAHFQVTVGDGLAVVEDIATRTIQEGIVDEGLQYSWTTSLHHGGDTAEPLEPSATTSSQEFALNKVESESDRYSTKDNGSVVQQAVEDMLGPFELSDKVHAQTPHPYLPGRSEVSSSSNAPTFSQHQESQNDPRVELIILDVDVGDARLGLSSPPQSFLERRFLLSARIALQKGGMLALNVVPSGEKPFVGVINSLTAVFAEVYEVALEDDVNHVVFALPSPASLNHDHLSSHTVDLVKRVVGDKLVTRIRRLDNLLNKDWARKDTTYS